MSRQRFLHCTWCGLASVFFGTQLLAKEPEIKENAGKGRITAESLWDLGRVGESAVSPDGKQLAYIVTRYSLKENASETEIHLADLKSTLEKAADGERKAAGFNTPALQLVNDRIGVGPIKGIQSVAWANRPGGLKLVYVAPGEGDNTDPQAWAMDLVSQERKQLSSIVGGVSNLKVSPTGKHLAFTIDVKLDATVQELYSDLPKADARIIDSLLYRHWNAWHDYAYSHLHIAEWVDEGSIGKAKDLMEGLKADCPLPPMGGAEQYEFSENGKELAFTMKMVDSPAESTDSSIFLVPIEGGQLKNITPNMPGYDMEPNYSPDG